MAGEPLDVFISYSHKDEALKDELFLHLKLLQREGKINTWQDREIEAGMEWDAVIKTQLEKAEIILLLVTTRFLASDYCYETEMQRAVQRHKQGTARVIPIILKSCHWRHSEFKVLQALPKDGKPISRWEDRDEAWFDVANGLRKVVDTLHEAQRHREQAAEAQRQREIAEAERIKQAQLDAIARQRQQQSIKLEQQRQQLAAQQQAYEQQQQAETERLQAERAELARLQAEQAELARLQAVWDRQEQERQAETERLQRERAELERLKAEWQQREQARRRQVTEAKKPDPKGVSTQPAELPKLQTIQFQTPTLRSEPGGLFGLGEKKWTTSDQPKQATQFSEDLGKGIALDMVKIPKGQFWMGSVDSEGYDRERPQYLVNVPEFWMGKYAVTQAQWTRVAAYPKAEMDLEPFPARFKGDNRPVEQVNWDQAVEFCQRLSRHTNRTYRLPSEAEWEYACRAGTTTPFHFGPTITTDLANYRGTDWEYKGKTYRGNYGQGPYGIFRGETTQVGSFPPNAFGLYDMHGNVWEWCQDVWHSNYDGAPADGSAWMADGDQDRRVLRGGSGFLSPVFCRSATRLYLTRAVIFNDVGFRVVCVPA